MPENYQSRSTLVDRGVTLSRVSVDGRYLSHREVHQLWRDENIFRRFYTDQLIAAGYRGFCWETPAISQSNLDEPHEWVVVESTSHESIHADPSPFAGHFQNTKELAVAFPNLGKNGIMIAPTADANFDGGSIGSFLRTASESKVDALWTLLGETVINEITDTPIWVSTAGLGVSWLHIRIDTRPKYYRYRPYC